MLFDLDNTLYPASSAIAELFDARITAYVQQVMHISADEAVAVRRDYLAQYGTTLRGLQNRYTVDVEDYLKFVHELQLQAVLSLDAELDRQLGELPARKIIFTNAPIEHANRVLEALGIAKHFERIFDIRYFEFQPKPNDAIYDRVLADLGISGSEAIFIEDTAQNLVPAKARGITTMLIVPPEAQTTQRQSDYLPTPVLEAAEKRADYVVPDIFAALEVVRKLLTPTEQAE